MSLADEYEKSTKLDDKTAKNIPVSICNRQPYDIRLNLDCRAVEALNQSVAAKYCFSTLDIAP